MKKSSCFGKILKWFGIFLLVLVLASMMSGNKETGNDTAPVKTSKPAPTATPTPRIIATSTPTSKPTEEPAQNIQPGIKGSQTYDVVLSLKDKGIPKAETQSKKDPHGNTIYSHSSSAMMDGVMVTYSIISNQNHEVSQATFSVSGKGETWYLPYCATMPYDAADGESAADWVEKNMKKEAQTQIGEAIFSIVPNKNGGATLHITCVGYEEWVWENLM